MTVRMTTEPAPGPFHASAPCLHEHPCRKGAEKPSPVAPTKRSDAVLCTAHVRPENLLRFYAQGLVALLAAVFFLTAARPFAAHAAALAEDHTVLYYLIEMQRRYKKTCAGTAMPEAPSLMPSETLRTLAGQFSGSPLPLEKLTTDNGLAGVPVFYTTVTGATPRQAADELMRQHCPSVMGTAYRYIGATREKGAWALLMAAAEPSRTESPQPPDPGAQRAGNPPSEGNALSAAGQNGPSSVPRERPGIVPLHEEAPPLPMLLAEPSSPAAQTPLSTAPPAAQPDLDLLPDIGHKSDALLTETSVGKRPSPAPVKTDPPAPAVVGSPAGRAAGAAAPAPAAQAGSFVPVLPAPGASEVETLFDQVNQVRTRGYLCGGTPMPSVTPVRHNPTLSAVAARHAKDMTVRGYFASTSPDGVRLGRRLTDAGYVWSTTAENLASVSPPASRALENWLAHEGP